MHAKSFAKVNLFLHLLARNSNGYHQIQSYMIFLSLFDEIFIEPASAYKSEILGENIRDNIVDKVVFILKKFLKQDILFRIKIKKNIPIAAGLGGGSSNAAVVLEMLLQYYQVSYSLKKVIYLEASAIGADIAFFLQSQNAFVEGIGDKILPIKLNEHYFILLVNPGIHISTEYAYENS